MDDFTNEIENLHGVLLDRQREPIAPKTEPKFFKIYEDSLPYLCSVPFKLVVLFVELAKLMPYAASLEQGITITPKIREHLCATLDIAPVTLRSYLSQLSSVRLVTTTGVSTYELNPYVIAYGPWQKISKRWDDGIHLDVRKKRWLKGRVIDADAKWAVVRSEPSKGTAKWAAWERKKAETEDQFSRPIAEPGTTD